jgi:hypothetical protein
MTPFIMDQESASKLKAIAAYAETHRVPVAEMQRRADDYGKGHPAQPFPKEHETELPFGFKVVYTIEQHPLKDGSGALWLRHMSMSAPRQGRVPHDLAMEWVMGQLGYTNHFRNCMVWPEDLGPERVAINVLEEFKDNAPGGTA